MIEFFVDCLFTRLGSSGHGLSKKMNRCEDSLIKNRLTVNHDGDVGSEVNRVGRQG